MSAQAVQGSPTKANRIPTQSNLLAKRDHLNTDAAIIPKQMDGYVDKAKNTLRHMESKTHRRGRRSAWEEISDDQKVKDAHAALLPILANDDESTHYAPTTQLLNRISLAVYKQLRQKESTDCARIFASNPRRTPGGDFLRTRHEPDYVTYLGTRRDLEIALESANHQRNLPWPEIDHVGEDKRPKNPDDGMAQLKSYMRTSKGYRPDLPTVHGFKVHNSQIMFALLNACDMWTTSAVDCNILDPWIAYVVTLYSLSDDKYRNPDLRYNAQQLDFVRWDVLGSARRQEYALSPFYVARAPGRGTFATFQISAGPIDTVDASQAYFAHRVKGFWKLSWQQKSARSNEKKLLQLLHSKGWLPGLVRLHENEDEYTTMTVSAREESGARLDAPPAPQSNAAAAATVPPSAPQPDNSDSASSARELEILHLASIGEPLSQLESPRALIHAFYDLLETLIHMWDAGVLHRDVSWFNVLYKGQHYTSEGKAVVNRPCIEEIMHAARSSKDTEPSTSQSKEFLPCILVTDLDHAIEKKLLEEDANAGREKTGTPMFMAVELSDYSKLKYRAGFIPDLELAIEATDTLPEAVLRIAFPKGDNDFMTKFRAVMEEERRRVRARPLTSKPVHRPQHDAESAFWVFFWAAIRALPCGAALESPSGADIDEFSKACKTMLDHIIADDVSDDRSKFLTKDADFQRLLHPALQPLVGLFETMALYLNVPWHHYEDEKKVEPDHAHVAFRRLLLRLELDLESANPAMLDLKFNTEHPRVLARKVVDDTERASALPDSRLSHVRASGRESPLSGFPDTSGRTSSKREASEPTDRGTGSSKKLATKKATASETAQFCTPGSSAKSVPAPDYSAVAGAIYNESDHFDKLTAHALCLKFRKDRQLWFSSGA